MTEEIFLGLDYLLHHIFIDTAESQAETPDSLYEVILHHI